VELIKQAEAFIVEQLGPFGPLMLVGVLGFMMIVATLPFLLKKEKDPLDRLKANQRTVQKMPGKTEKLRNANGKDKLEKYASFLEPQDEEDYSAIKLKLMQAGYMSKNAVRMFHFAQFALGIIGLILGAVYALLNSTPESKRYGRALRCAGYHQLYDRSDPIAAIRDIDLGCVAGLCWRNAG